MIYALKFEDANALGFFAMACSPGGSASNAYTYLLAGDVSLSVTMTLCSTILSLGELVNLGPNFVCFERISKIPVKNDIVSEPICSHNTFLGTFGIMLVSELLSFLSILLVLKHWW